MTMAASGTISDMQPLRRPAVAVTAPIVAATIAVAGAALAAWARAGGTGGTARRGLAARDHRADRGGRMRAGTGPAGQPRRLDHGGRCHGVGSRRGHVRPRGPRDRDSSRHRAGSGLARRGGSAVRAVGWGAAAVAVPVVLPGRPPAGASLAVAGLDAGRQPRGDVSRRRPWILMRRTSSCRPLAGAARCTCPATVGSLANLLGTLSLPLTAATVVGSVTGMVSAGDEAARRCAGSC